MCLDCDCGKTADDHGDSRHLVYADLLDAADASNVTVEQAALNVVKGVQLALSPADAFDQAANRPLIVSDVDNTVALFTGVCLTLVNVVFKTSYTIDAWTTYDGPFTSEQKAWLKAQRQNPITFLNYPPDTEAVTFYQKIYAAGYPLAFSSNRPAVCGAVSSRWLDDNNVPRDRELFAGPGGKEQLLASHGPRQPAVLIDDCPANWLTVPRPGIEVWSPRRAYTPASADGYPNVRVFDSWAEPLAWLGVS